MWEETFLWLTNFEQVKLNSFLFRLQLLQEEEELQLVAAEEPMSSKEGDSLCCGIDLKERPIHS